MTEKDIIISITESQKLLNSLKLLESFINKNSLKVNKEFNKIALDSKSKYEEIFLIGLEKTYYNFILKDYSFFQFSFSKDINEKTKIETPSLRFSFYPNPFENIDNDLIDFHSLYLSGDLDFEDYSQILSEANLVNKKVSIRYDLSYKQHKKIYHPSAHYHFGIAENSRIATDKIFTPLTFTVFILNMYYMDVIESESDCEFNLTTKFNRLIKDLEKVTAFNTKEDDYFCFLQDGTLSIK